jgi:putative transposase
MIRGHMIALDPTPEDRIYFAKAAGTARFAYNWALAEWRWQYIAGLKPSSSKLRLQWNEIRHRDFPWSDEVTKCAGGQAINDLGTAFDNFFEDLKKPKADRHFHYPCFKKKNIDDRSFALWNDQFRLDGKRVHIPKLGWVRMREALRFDGKILGARVKFRAGRWFISIQVEMPEPEPVAIPGIVGVDLGIAALMTGSDGTVIANPKPRRRLLRRQKRLQRRISRQRKNSRRQGQRRARLARLHYRMACIRKDATHKATTKISRSFGTIVLEDLNVAGMGKNHALAGAVADAAFGEIRRQFTYKAQRTVFADRFFPSSKTCSVCGLVKDELPLGMRLFVCDGCGSVKDRDRNAADNLERVGRATAEPAGQSRSANARGHHSAGRRKRGGETAMVEPRTRASLTSAHI